MRQTFDVEVRDLTPEECLAIVPRYPRVDIADPPRPASEDIAAAYLAAPRDAHVDRAVYVWWGAFHARRQLAQTPVGARSWRQIYTKIVRDSERDFRRVWGCDFP
jgi:hypothetical protein